MDKYSRACIVYLLENNPASLAVHVNKICNTNTITLEAMNADGVEQTILDSVSETPAKMEKSAIECKKCNEAQVSFVSYQARGADEGESVFYFCGACLHHWRDR